MAPKKPVGKGKKGGANMPMEDAIPPPLPMPGADFGVVTREVVRPSNQLQLSDADMNEEIAKMLTANNPQAPTNIARYNMKERAYKFEAMVEQTIVHYATDGWLVHKTSDDARKQLAEEKVQAEAIAKFQAEVDKAAADKERGVETQEPDDSRQLRNQFNFSERAAETVNFPMRDRETFTSPPPTATVSGSCTFWEIFDEYYRDVMRQRMEDSAKGKKKDVKEEKKAPAPPPVDVPPMASPAMELALRTVDRMVNQNRFKEIITDYKYWDDPADAIRTRDGSLLPLWGFNKEDKLRKNVTALAWSPAYMDMYAVGYGSYNFQKQAGGIIQVFSLKNPLHAEYAFTTDSGVISLAFHPEFANLLAVGCYDGTVLVFDIRGGTNVPMYAATAKSGKHNDPVWGVAWQVDELQKSLQFCSISTDGQVILWTLSKSELQHEVIIKLRAPGATPGPDGPVSMVSGGCCMDFCKAPGQDHMYLVGTEEGNVHRCSKAYSGGDMGTYGGHAMAVYAVRWNAQHPRMFLSASADWSVRVWDSKRTDKPVMRFDLGDAVGDAAWAPFSSTVFAALTDDGKVHVFDLAENRLAPLCSQKISKRKLTKLAFNPHEPILLVGDCEGVVHCLKLSPNLRKAAKPAAGQKASDAEIAKLDKVCEVAWKSQAADKD